MSCISSHADVPHFDNYFYTLIFRCFRSSSIEPEGPEEDNPDYEQSVVADQEGKYFMFFIF